MASNLTEAQIADYREVFAIFDKDNSGNITAAELGEVMKSLGLNPTEDELRDMVNEIDADQNGTIDFEEFIQLMSHTVGPSNLDEELQKAFEVFDRDGSGSISTDELRQVMKKLGQDLTDSEINDMIKMADKDGNGVISLDEFKHIMTQD